MKRATSVFGHGLFVGVLAMVISIAVSVSLAAEHTKDSLKTVRKNIEGKKAVLLDVREPREWDVGHLKWATLVPLSELRKKAESKEFAERLTKKVPKEKIIYWEPSSLACWRW